MGSLVFYGGFAGRETLEAYARKVRKWLSDAGKDLKDLSTLDERDAFMAEKDEVVEVEPVFAAVPTVDNYGFVDANKADDWELEGAVGLDEVARAVVKHKLRELQEKCHAER